MKSYDTTSMIFLSNNNSALNRTGNVIYNSDLKELILWTGSAWKILSGNPQKKNNS